MDRGAKRKPREDDPAEAVARRQASFKEAATAPAGASYAEKMAAYNKARNHFANLRLAGQGVPEQAGPQEHANWLDGDSERDPWADLTDPPLC